MRVVSLDVQQGGRPAPGALQLHGPLVEVVLSGPDGTTVKGHGIIDTGATTTCFDIAAAERAKMPIVRTGKMSSATHRDEVVPVFSGSVDIVGLANFDLTAGALGCNLGGDVIALIGRDVLRMTLLILQRSRRPHVALHLRGRRLVDSLT